MTSNRRCLIVNADDFGLSPGVNRGIIGAHERGIVTSASLMVRWPAAPEAAALARAHPKLSVGLHVDLCEWTYTNDEWRPAYEVVPLENPVAVAEELARQLKAFRELMGANPTHLDSHQHVHRAEPLYSLLVHEARELGVVLRDATPAVRYAGDFYGQSNKGYPCPESISVQALSDLLRNLPSGCTELGCHPAEEADMQGMYRLERIAERDTLCDPRIRAALDSEAIVLCSFRNWRDYCPEASTR